MEKNADYHFTSGSESPENLPVDYSEANKLEVSAFFRTNISRNPLTRPSCRPDEAPKSMKPPTSLAMLPPLKSMDMSLEVSSLVTSNSSPLVAPSVPVSSWALGVPSFKPVLCQSC